MPKAIPNDSERILQNLIYKSNVDEHRTRKPNALRDVKYNILKLINGLRFT